MSIRILHAADLHLDAAFEGLSAPSKEKLQACAAAVSRYVREVSIRGVD